MKVCVYLVLCVATVSVVYCGDAYNGGAIYPRGPLPGWDSSYAGSQWKCKGVWAGECQNKGEIGECCMKHKTETEGRCHKFMKNGYPCTRNETKRWTPGGMLCPCEPDLWCVDDVCKGRKQIEREAAAGKK